jgi:hypothetical protein
LFKNNKYDFKEVRTSNRKFMEFGKTKFYISDNPSRDMACKLLHHELGMIKNVKDYAIKTYMEDRYRFMDRVDEKLYIGCCFDQFDSFFSDDIWEIEITSANPTTGLRYTDFANACKQVGLYYGIPVVDLHGEMGLNKLTKINLLTDEIHPNDNGGKRIAELVIGKLKSINIL